MKDKRKEILLKIFDSNSIISLIITNADFLHAMESKYCHEERHGWSLIFDIEDEDRVFHRTFDINGVVGGNYGEEESVSPHTRKCKKVRKTYTLEIVTSKKLRVTRNEYDGFIEFRDDYSSCTFQGEIYKRD